MSPFGHTNSRTGTRPLGAPERKTIMHTLAALFTAERRQQIQVFAGSLAPIAILIGFGTDGVWEQSLIILGAVLQFVSSVLSLVNVRKGDWGAGWAILRGAIYLAASTVSPALVLLGFYDAATNATILVGVSLGLGALSNLLSIFIGKQQELDAVRAAFVVSPDQTREQWRADNNL